MRERGGLTSTRSTMPGIPLFSSTETRASPTPIWVMAVSVSSAGFWRKVVAAARTAFWSLGVKARRACCTRLPSWPSTDSGTSSGLWVIKYTPTPLERINRTTCSILLSSALGASLNSRCASSKKNTKRGLSASPTSGRFSNSSDSSHSKNVAYRRGLWISLSAARILTNPRPSGAVRSRSQKSSIGSPKKCSPPSRSSTSRLRWMAPILAAETLP